MRHLTLVAIVLGALALSGATSAMADERSDHDRRMGWFRDARFGMFIHWGLYAIPGGVWKGQPDGGAGEWILNGAKIDPAAYRPLQGEFNPVQSMIE